MFLFNKRVLQFFRKDGHNWRKKKDGRAVGEAHERLKVCDDGDAVLLIGLLISWKRFLFAFLFGSLCLMENLVKMFC